MKGLVLLTLVCCAVGRPQSAPEGAILLLPASPTPTPANQSADGGMAQDQMPRTAGGTFDIIQPGIKYNFTPSEKQPVPTKNGTYHIYIPGGGLKRVDFTISPAKKQPAQPRSVSGRSLKSGADTNSVYKFFYVKLPADFLPPNSTAEESQAATPPQDSASTTTSEPPTTDPAPLPLGVFYLFDSVERNGPSAVGRNLGEPSGEAERNRTLPSQAELVATVRLSDVQPLSGPVYSYSPRSLVRILRGTPAIQPSSE